MNEFTRITSENHPIPKMMKVWVPGDPDQLILVDKPIEMPNKTEVLVRIDAVFIYATDLDVISKSPPVMIQGGLPFNKNLYLVMNIWEL